MANQDQKTILIEQASKDIQKICIKFQTESGSSNSEIKDFLTEIANLWKTETKNKFGFQ